MSRNVAILYHTRMYNDLTVDGSLSAAGHDFYVSATDGFTVGVPTNLTDNLTVRETLEVTNTTFHVKTNLDVFLDASGRGVVLTNGGNVLSVLEDKIDVSGTLHACEGILHATKDSIELAKGDKTLLLDASGTVISTASNAVRIDVSGTTITGDLAVNNVLTSTASAVTATFPDQVFRVDASGTKVTGSFAVNDDFIIDGSGAVTSSDRRIKDNIEPIVDARALIRRLVPSTYTYIDRYHHGDQKTYGFIAQDVKSVIPEATLTKQGMVPSIYTWGVVKDNTIVLDEPIDVAVPAYFRITSPSRIEGKITRIDSNVLHIADTSVDLVDGHRVFVYGTQVEDFHYLDKDVIFTVAVGAVQELETALEQEKEKTKALEARLAKLEARFDALSV